jgi:hypothetical protein
MPSAAAEAVSAADISRHDSEGGILFIFRARLEADIARSAPEADGASGADPRPSTADEL